jgi:hypothetical protein
MEPKRLNVVGLLVLDEQGKHKLISLETVDPVDIEVELVEASLDGVGPCIACAGAQNHPLAPDGWAGGVCPLCGGEG